MSAFCSASRGGWPLERVLYVLAGACPASLALQRVFGLRSLSS